MATVPAGENAAFVSCFHCGEPVIPGDNLRVTIDGVQQPMCCQGCETAARMIVEAGLGDFYRYRTRPSPHIEDLPQAVKDRLRAFDHPHVSGQFERGRDDGAAEVSLLLDKVSCPACLWLIERYLGRKPGVLDCGINYSTRTARIVHDGRISLRALIETIQRLGYDAQPFDPSVRLQMTERERARLLRQLGVSLVLGMQVMMVTGAFYFDRDFIAADHRRLLNMINLMLTAPVVFYSGLGFLQSAWRGLRRGVLNMDLSVSLGILLAYAGSVQATVVEAGTTYFDSVVMFVSLLLVARYLEFTAHRRASETVERMTRPWPMLATRLRAAPAGDRMESVPVAELVAGDRVLVKPGEIIPADGEVTAGASSTDESLLTGESTPVLKQAGAAVIGGSLNIGSPLQMKVVRVGDNTLLASIVKLLSRAQSERPRMDALAERISGWFVLAVLVAAGATAILGHASDVPDWFERVVAVLVITCPCALSLATPLALTCAINSLMARGVVLARGSALETLAAVTHVVFDKTGTLTHGRLRLTGIHTFAGIDQRTCLRIAAALERHSEHPIALALVAASNGESALATAVSSAPGAGVEGTYLGRRWYLGTDVFIRARTGHEGVHATIAAATPDDTVVVLANEQETCCIFILRDEIRAEAAGLVKFLTQQDLVVMLLSGDRATVAARVAGKTGIDSWQADLSPQDKLNAVRDLQRHGAVVMMVGDGVNDAPVLAGAQVSVAMQRGAPLSHLSADIVLLRDELSVIGEVWSQARKTRRVIRGNLGWALVYNLFGLPAAIFGWISPLVAALGMSSSSLVVTANALRLRRVDT